MDLRQNDNKAVGASHPLSLRCIEPAGMSYRACKASVSMPADRPRLVYALFMPCLCLVYGFYVPCMCLGYASSHVMPTLAWAMAAICGCGHLFPSFPLDRKGPKGQGRHHGPYTHGGRSSPMSARPAHPTQPRFGVPSLSERSSHVMPTLACERAGIYGCNRHEPARLIMKTRHCISGCGRLSRKSEFTDT